MGLITDEIFYNALRRSEAVTAATGGRIYSTCVEVPPMEQDNTPLPYVIITFDGLQNDGLTKDDYEGDTDTVSISIEVSAESRRQVGELARLIRQTVRDYLRNIDEDSDDYPLCPDDYQLSASGVAWDWTKPCYYQTMTYKCSTKNDTI